MRLDSTLINFVTENYRKIATVLFVVLMAVTLASITKNIVSIATEKNLDISARDYYTEDVTGEMFGLSKGLDFYFPVTDRNIFDSQNRQPTTEKRSSSRSENSDKSSSRPYDGPPVKSSINATLIGTMVFSDPSFSFARVARGSGSAGEINNYYIGDSLFGEATVKKVERNRLYITREGRTEYLEIEGASGTVMPSYSRNRASVPYTQPQEQSPAVSADDVRSIGDNKYLINKKMLDSLLSNYNDILTQARAVPNLEDGKTNGFKIFSIKPGSIYQAIGIRNGDILSRVNGNDINSLEKVLSLFTQLRNESNLTMDIVRGGQKMSYEYEIK